MAGSISAGDGEERPEPAGLRRLRRLVTALTVTLIVGTITVVALLVIRLSRLEPPRPALPAALALPAGEAARAVTLGTGWVAVVTEDTDGAERIRVFDATSGAQRGAIKIAH